MKKIAIIVPANIFRAPYINYFASILKKENIEFDIISWNKEGVKEEGIQFEMEISNNTNFLKKFFCYWRFKKFVERKLLLKHYDFVIVHTLQLNIFIQNFLYKKYRGKYIVDIRDYSIFNIFKRRLKKLLMNSRENFISSEGFKEWLPKNIEYTLSHNTNLNTNLQKIKIVEIKDFTKQKLIFSTIGSLRDKKITFNIINSLKNSTRIDLYFFGDGPISSELKKIKLNNFKYYGKYKKDQEENFYKKSDLINILLPKDNINSKTLMPNRFYNALFCGKLIVATEGTYVGDIIKKYNLGIVINLDNIHNLENCIFSELKKLDLKKYNLGRNRMISKIKEEENNFEKILKKIVE